MGSVKFVDTHSGPDGTYSTIEYEFSDYADFKDFQESQRQAVSTVINNMMFGSGYGDDYQSPTEDLEGDEEGSPIVNTRVKKKETMH